MRNDNWRLQFIGFSSKSVSNLENAERVNLSVILYYPDGVSGERRGGLPHAPLIMSSLHQLRENVNVFVCS